ncbi:MAG TPA: HDOD domain-containing protein [Clostridiales bacterium]|nr:HDOD domain-containing protein [Clostridiales bacterium]
MNVYFARQPILDEKLNLFGYELLFRPNPQADAFAHPMDGNSATSSILSALEWSGIEKVTGGTHAFVNFTEQLLLAGYPTHYPNQHLVVEVLETVRIHPKVLACLYKLKEKGYRIALDDYTYRPNDQSLLSLCDIVKVEVDGSAKSFQNLERVANAVNLQQCRILAEKVETQQDFETSKAMGCTLFQGYFFARPNIVTEKAIHPLKISQMRLLREISKPEVEFQVLANIIKNDVALTAKTLRLVNSPYYGVLHEVKSIGQALALLGLNELQRWLIYSSLVGLCDNKPSELIILSMVRAHFCENVGVALKGPLNADGYALIGLLSLLDTLTGCDMVHCLEQMQIPKVTRKALLEAGNDGRHILDLIIAFEHGNWKNVSRLCSVLGLKEALAHRFYLEAVQAAQRYLEADQAEEEPKAKKKYSYR